MMNLIQKFFSKNHSDKNLLRKNFTEYFFSIPEHQWLTSKEVRSHFERLFSHLPVGVLEAMMVKYPIVFVPSHVLREQRSVGMEMRNTIVVFPEFQKLLNTKQASAVAYLAHELAFVLYELEGERQDPLMAEVEADKFVCDLGFTFELEELLLMLDETIEKRLRLTYLTINHFSHDN